MALNFPSAPVVGQEYQRWRWNGTAWVPIQTVAVPMLPIAGGNITGNLAVAGTTTLTGTLTALGHSQINTLDVAGAADFADGVTIDGDDAATKPWVEEQIAAGSLWQGTWDAATNVPDLTNANLQNNGFTWAVTLADPTASFAIPATPAIPGLNGLTVYNGDHVIWSDSASAFEVVHGSSLSLQEAKAMFGPRTATVVVGNSVMHAVDSVDYRCDGTTDVATIQLAIDSLPAAGGTIVIREGDYNLDGQIEVHIKQNIVITGVGSATNFNLLGIVGSANQKAYFNITTNVTIERLQCTLANQPQADSERVMAVFWVTGGLFSRFDQIDFYGRNLTINLHTVFRNTSIFDWVWDARNDSSVIEVFKCNVDFDNVANYSLTTASSVVEGSAVNFLTVIEPANLNVAVRRGIKTLLKECVWKIKNNNQVSGTFRMGTLYSFNNWIENNYLDIDRASTSILAFGGNPTWEAHFVGNTIMCGEIHDRNSDSILNHGGGASVRHMHMMNNYIVVANAYNCSGSLIYMNGGVWARDNYISVTVRSIGTRGAMCAFMTAGTYSGSTFDNNRINIIRDETTEPTDFPRAFFCSTNQSWATVQNVTIINNMINYNIAGTDPWYLWADRSNSGFAQLIEPGGPGTQGNILAWNRSGLFAFTRF